MEQKGYEIRKNPEKGRVQRYRCVSLISLMIRILINCVYYIEHLYLAKHVSLENVANRMIVFVTCT